MEKTASSSKSKKTLKDSKVYSKKIMSENIEDDIKQKTIITESIEDDKPKDISTQTLNEEVHLNQENQADFRQTQNIKNDEEKEDKNEELLDKKILDEKID